uniref:Transmembrane protein n=1 Tax=Panagrellus redivivus TaxID=6233 RepID=A0A7E4W1Z9_PANRE
MTLALQLGSLDTHDDDGGVYGGDTVAQTMDRRRNNTPEGGSVSNNTSEQHQMHVVIALNGIGQVGCFFFMFCLTQHGNPDRLY